MAREKVTDFFEIQTNNKITIWLREKKIFAIATEGYSFGAEQAQVRLINDNDHFIPLYSYGVGTFDFDHKKSESDGETLLCFYRHIYIKGANFPTMPDYK